MMEFGYQKIRTISTTDLPGVFIDPAISLEVLNSPPFLLTKLILEWEQGEYTDDQALITIGSILIQSVTNHTGERYEMGSVENIQAFVEATDIEALKVIIRGWLGLVGVERLTAKKKLRESPNPSPSTNGKKQAQKQLSKS